MPKTPAERAAYQKQYRLARRDAFFSDKTCAQCGTTHKLRLRYIGPEPAPDLSTLWDWPQHRREATLAHCKVLCSPHQRAAVAKTLMERKELPSHGLARSYLHDCHCELCALCRRQYIHLYRSIRFRLKKMGIVIPLHTPDPYAPLPELVTHTHTAGCADPASSPVG